MDTSKMKRFNKLDSAGIAELLAGSVQLREIADALLTTFDENLTRNQIVELVEQHYDLGKVTDVYEIFGGYVNRSFGIYTEKDGERLQFFVRKYKKEVTEKEILFEHNLINYSIANGLDVAAGLHPAKNGKTYVQIAEGSGENRIEWYYAIYDYLEGEDKYTWVDNECNDEEYISSAQVLAIFHNASRSFDPRGLERVEPKIMELLPLLPGIFEGYAATRCEGNRFHNYFLKNFNSIIKEINHTVIPAEDMKQMVYNPIHCDFHPGNLKFRDNKVVGIFDFDWSKIDLRMFEIGLGLVYCCSSWIDELDGTLNLHACEVFLKAYQKKLQELGGLPPINEVEKKYLTTMLAAGNMYLIFWCLRSYYGDMSLNVFEYLAYLQHQVKLMYWIEEHRDEIQQIAEVI